MLTSLSSFTLVILSGYLIVNAIPYLRFKSFLADRYRLLLDAAVFGFIGYALFALLPDAYFELLESHIELSNQINGIFGKDHPADPKALYLFSHVAVALALLRAIRRIAEKRNWTPLLNLLNASASSVVMRHGSEMLRLLNKAFEEQIPVQITLDDRKVYIGLVASTIRPESNVRDIKLVPYESGYRNRDTLEYRQTTSYMPFIELFDYYSAEQRKTAAQTADDVSKQPWDDAALADTVFKVEGQGFATEFSGKEIERLAEIFGLVVKWDKIESMTLWDEKLGAYFAATSKPHEDK